MIDISANTLSVDNKPVKWMTINGHIVYSTTIDSSPVSLALENITLSASGTPGVYAYTPPGDSESYSANIYTVPAATFWNGGNGSGNLFPVSKHVFARAQHYNSTITEFKCADQTFTVSAQENLLEWAKSNGFDPAFIDSLSSCASDIQMVTTSSDQFSEDDVPYYIDEMTFKGIFHRDDFKGLAGWCGTQIASSWTEWYSRPQPVVFTTEVTTGDSAGELKWSTPNMLSSLVPDGEQYAFLKALEPSYLGTTGDSGKPIYLTIGGGKNIVVSHNHQVYKPAFNPSAPYYMTGPNYIKAFPLLKTYVESKGDTIKTLED